MHSRPRKQFGQHWLRSPAALQSILAAAELKAEDCVLEIGPGQGVLTRELLTQSGEVIAVEIDRDLCVGLRKQFGAATNFLLEEGDFLERDRTQPLISPSGKAVNKIVANIPYNITGPILERLLGKISAPRQPAFDNIVLLVQREVAERVCAQPGSKSFGALTVRVQYLATCELICAVPSKDFYPPPKVDSAVIRLRPRPCSVAATDPKQLESLVKVGFATKRKMLRNNLKGIVERDRLTEILVSLGSKPEARGEELSLEQWVRLSNRLAKPENISSIPEAIEN